MVDQPSPSCSNGSKEHPNNNNNNNNNKNESLIVQSLVEVDSCCSTKNSTNTYALRKSPIVPWNKQLLSIITVPLMMPVLALWSVAMATPLKNTLLSMVIPKCMDVVGKEFSQERQTLLQDLHGKILDVGSGGGAYLDYCPTADTTSATATSVTNQTTSANGDRIDEIRNDDNNRKPTTEKVIALEPNRQMHNTIRTRGKHLVKENKLEIVSSMEEVLANEAPESFDWVILGNVLCEVNDVAKTLDQIDQLLKPGGKVYFSEHVARPVGTWQRRYQDWINPLFRHIGGGCNCNHDSLLEMQKRRNWNVIFWQYEHVQVCMGYFVVGLAQKLKDKQDKLN